MLTWTIQGALNATNSATRQENALPPDIAHEALIAEPQFTPGYSYSPYRPSHGAHTQPGARQ